MEFADFELSRTLHELSDWSDTDFVYWVQPGGQIGTRKRRSRLGEGEIPAYDLGFLVRRLPYSVSVTKTMIGFTSTAAQMRWRHPFYSCLVRGSRPEDTTAELMIDMWKCGVMNGIPTGKTAGAT